MKKFLVLTGAAVLFFGCAAQKEILKPDQALEEAKAAIEQAKADIADAKTAGAAELAKDILDSAESKLVIAEESFAKKDYGPALTFAKKASEDAKLAKFKALAANAIKKAKEDIAAAKEAKAEVLAPDLMNSAEANLELAKKAFEAKDWQKALELAKKASDDANEAMKMLEMAKKAAELIEQAKTEIKEAEKMGAAKLAAELLKSAKDNLEKAVKSNLEKDFIKAIDFASKAIDDAKAAKAACQTNPKGDYQVKKGDNLWNISKKSSTYNDPFLWPLIYKANRGQINDPDLIYPKQNFILPPSDDMNRETAIKDARKYRKK